MKKGFTLVELLVSLSIIGLLVMVIVAGISGARKQARVLQRLADIKQVQSALDLYYSNNRSYPSTGGAYRSACPQWGQYNRDDVIPGLAPTYIKTVPIDPQTYTSGNTASNTNTNCYVYRSDGVDYAFIVHLVSDLAYNGSAPNYLSYPELLDSQRDGGTNSYTVDASAPWAWKVYSSGAVSW